ncbi:MAG: DUF3151 domain-containing protein [Flaviflexus sp.]|uniref:DUF3151 domain-containing protein n=1 Tax=Flaviflexus sp. TaxID=1969482 RepID=UPI00352FCEB2
MQINIGPEATRLPEDPEVDALIESHAPEDVARLRPDSPLAWANLAQEAWEDGEELESYAYARVGYHRGLDLLRKNGWRGTGPVPYSHVPNRGFLSALFYLGRAAEVIGETPEKIRIDEFLETCDPKARAELDR